MKNLRYACGCGKWFSFEAEERENFGAAVQCPFCGEQAGAAAETEFSKTGSYKYCRQLGRIIKISDGIPGLAGGGGSCAGCAGGSCSSCGHH